MKAERNTGTNGKKSEKSFKREERMELNPRGQGHFLRAVYRCSTTFPLVIPTASVWEIFQVKLQQALHFRPLQGLYRLPEFHGATSSALRIPSFAVSNLEIGETLETDEGETFFIYAMLSFTFDCCVN